MSRFGHFTGPMLGMLRIAIEGRHVWDLGCGVSLNHCDTLFAAKAAKITAVEKENPNLRRVRQLRDSAGKRFSFKQMTFEKLLTEETPEIDVAFVSWPHNAPSKIVGLPRLLASASTIIYLGCNMDGSACGTPEMFSEFIMRRLIVSIPHKWNTMLILGERQDTQRMPTSEEMAVLTGALQYYEDEPHEINW
jgi:hypothetical protein